MDMDPTQIRLSETFLLSDFFGNHSVYTYGWPNKISDDANGQIVLMEAKKLAQALDEAQELLGPCSISFGRVSTDIAKRMGRPTNRRDYHTYLDGAAADVVFHDEVMKPKNSGAPIVTAHRINAELPYSRMITYSESPFICFATSFHERKPARVFYINEYMGFRVPRRYKVNTRQTHDLSFVEHGLEVDWRGQGHPTYHLRGKRQLQHKRVGRYCILTDWLYDRDAVVAGQPNWVPRNGLAKRHVQQQLKLASKAVSHVVERIGRRVSIVRGYKLLNGETWEHRWERGFRFTIVPPSSVHTSDVAHALEELPYVKLVMVAGDTIKVMGY